IGFFSGRAAAFKDVVCSKACDFIQSTTRGLRNISESECRRVQTDHNQFQHCRSTIATAFHSRKNFDLLGSIAKNSLQLKEFFQTGLTPLTTIARSFVASKATSEVESSIVNMYVARANSLCHPARPLDVS